MVEHARTAGFSGFTPAGTAKDIPKVIVALAEVAHRDGLPFKIGVITGASTGGSLDGALCNANAISFRTPYHFGLPADPVRNVELPREYAAYVVSLRKSWTHGSFYHRGDRDDWRLSERCLCRGCDRASNIPRVKRRMLAQVRQHVLPLCRGTLGVRQVVHRNFAPRRSFP